MKLHIVITDFDKTKEKEVLELLVNFASIAKIPVNSIHWVITDELGEKESNKK